MWLLNSKTAELKQFPSSEAVRYAIISHVWQQEPKEQTFHEIRAIAAQCKATGADPTPLMSRKIQDCCAMAAHAGYDWLWLDAACIDHNSSAELSEAINSMYTWYADAQVCYAYLHDVGDDEDPSAEGSAFRRSVWHTRGWTLQELLAPACVIFLSRAWHTLGSKHSLVTALSEVSGIKREVLMRDRADWLEGVSVAERMSWAAHRRTTRVEDRAYSLMGIFGINMPTIYGEGPRAFMRLQEEILQRIPDQSIFAWGHVHPDFEVALHGLQADGATDAEEELAADETAHGAQSGLEDLLAPSPAEFAFSAEIKALSMQDLAIRFGVGGRVPQYTLTSYGMLMQLPMSPNLMALRTNDETPASEAEGVPAKANAAMDARRSVYVAVLACTNKHNTLIALLLRPIQHASSLQYSVGAHIGGAVGTYHRYYRAALCPGFVSKYSKKPLSSLSSDALQLKELYIRHAYATLTLGQARIPQRVKEAEEGRTLYHTFHIPQWALNRLEARHGLSVRPESVDGLVLRVPHDARSGKLEPAVSSAQFLDAARREIVIVRIGVGCSCFDQNLGVPVLQMEHLWIDARIAPVAIPGYAQSYGEPLSLGEGSAIPAQCAVGRAHLGRTSFKGKAREGASAEAFVAAFDAPEGRRLEVRIEPRQGFEPASSSIAGSFSVTLNIKDIAEEPTGSVSDAQAADVQSASSVSRMEEDPTLQPPEDGDAASVNVDEPAWDEPRVRFSPSPTIIRAMADIFRPRKSDA